MATEVDKFKAEVEMLGSEDAQEVDELCLKWLVKLTEDYGKEGKVAKSLLRLVRELLEI